MSCRSIIIIFVLIFPSYRFLWSVAGRHDTKQLHDLQTCGSCLRLHWVRHRPFEKLYQRIAGWRCRNGKQSLPQRETAGTGASLTWAFMTKTASTSWHKLIDEPYSLCHRALIADCPAIIWDQCNCHPERWRGRFHCWLSAKKVLGGSTSWTIPQCVTSLTLSVTRCIFETLYITKKHSMLSFPVFAKKQSNPVVQSSMLLRCLYVNQLYKTWNAIRECKPRPRQLKSLQNILPSNKCLFPRSLILSCELIL